MNVNSIPSTGSALGGDLDRLKGMPKFEALSRLSAEFESIFAREILKSAHKPLFGSGLAGGDAAGSIYRDILVDHLAASMSNAGGIGFSKALERELTQLLDGKAKARFSNGK